MEKHIKVGGLYDLVQKKYSNGYSSSTSKSYIVSQLSLRKNSLDGFDLSNRSQKI